MVRCDGYSADAYVQSTFQNWMRVSLDNDMVYDIWHYYKRRTVRKVACKWWHYCTFTLSDPIPSPTIVQTESQRQQELKVPIIVELFF